MLGRDLKRILIMYSPDYDMENTYPVFFTKCSDHPLYFIFIDIHGGMGLRNYDLGGSMDGDNSPSIGDIIRIMDDDKNYKFYDMLEKYGSRFYHIEGLTPDKGKRNRVLVALMED